MASNLYCFILSSSYLYLYILSILSLYFLSFSYFYFSFWILILSFLSYYFAFSFYILYWRYFSFFYSFSYFSFRSSKLFTTPIAKFMLFITSSKSLFLYCASLLLLWKLLLLFPTFFCFLSYTLLFTTPSLFPSLFIDGFLNIFGSFDSFI